MRGAFAFLLAAGLLFAAAPAGAVTLTKQDTFRQLFIGDGCGDVDIVRQTIWESRYSGRVKKMWPVSPRIGHVLYDDYTWQPVARISTVREDWSKRRRPALVWEATGSDSSCEPGFEDSFWSTEDVPLRMKYRIDVPVRSWEAEGAMRKMLKRKWSWWENSYEHGERCRHRGRDRFKCVFSFYAGDVVTTAAQR